MSTSEKNVKVRKHKLSKNRSLIHVLHVTLLMMIGYFALSQFVLSMVLGLPISIIFNVDPKMLTCLLSCIGGILMLFFYYWWFKPEYQWKPRNTALACKVSAPILIYWFIFYVVLITLAEGHLTFSFEGLTLSSFVFAAMAGICEEMAFREVAISYMKRQLREDKWNIPILLFTSVIFGISHLSNAISGSAPLCGRMAQVLGTLMFGIFLGAVFLRTGNIWACIVTHTIYDTLPSLFMTKMDADFKFYNWGWMLVGQALLAAWGLYLLRKEKRPEINALWNDKWQFPEEPETAEK